MRCYRGFVKGCEVDCQYPLTWMRAPNSSPRARRAWPVWRAAFIANAGEIRCVRCAIVQWPGCLQGMWMKGESKLGRILDFSLSPVSRGAVRRLGKVALTRRILESAGSLPGPQTFVLGLDRPTKSASAQCFRVHHADTGDARIVSPSDVAAAARARGTCVAALARVTGFA